MTENGPVREKTFDEELPYFKERIKEVFDNYSNPNGNEDTLEICVLRQSHRIVLKAEQLINHLRTEKIPCNIGDTVYCVNGYGSKRYIETFTVAEFRITKDGIWLTDTNGMEWLARACHFNRASAEKELKSTKEMVDIINENFNVEDVTIQLEYAHDENPQSKEIRKDIENYIRRLKEQRNSRKSAATSSAENSFLHNRFMRTE